MRVLVACEFSGTVRREFRKLGHDAWSCDLLPADDRDYHHYQCDVIPMLYDMDWDLLIAHPPCTYLAVSGAAHFNRPGRREAQRKALEFVVKLLNAPIKRICVENPVSVISSTIGPPTQIIHPWQFGHGERKATCLWLRNLPRLKPTNIVKGREEKNRNFTPGPDRWKLRSKTYEGIARAMATQWNNPRQVGFGLRVHSRLKEIE